MSIVISIGGGSMKEGATKQIDQEIYKRTNKKNPNALFIPTASSDDEEYTSGFHKIYGKMGCKTEHLYLKRENPLLKEIKDKISKADIIYVGGGNTLMMMKLWRRLGVDKMILKANKRGAVCAGLSAGALCWFEYGHSDSVFYYTPENWDYIRVKCLDVVGSKQSKHIVTLCPHYDAEKRDQSFESMIKKFGGVGIALDNNCAIEVIDDKYRIITSSKKAGAYKVYKIKGKIFSEEIPQKTQFSPIKPLLTI